MRFKQWFIKLLGFFLDLKFDIFYPWIPTWKQQYHGFSWVQIGKKTSNQEKIWENSLLVLFLFTGPIIMTKSMIWYNVKLSKVSFWKMPEIWDTLINVNTMIYRIISIINSILKSAHGLLSFKTFYYIYILIKFLFFHYKITNVNSQHTRQMQMFICSEKPGLKFGI